MYKKILFCLIASITCLQAAEKAPCANATWVFEHLDTIADFPQPGIQFKSITPLLKNPEAFKRVIKLFADRYRDTHLDAIVGLDSRGFIFGTALAYELNLPFLLVRKQGKLPGDVISVKYDLEYGKSCFEMEKSSIKKGQKVLIVDDVLATGGTMKAAGELITKLGGQVYEGACLIEIPFLKGRDTLSFPLFSVVTTD